MESETPLVDWRGVDVGQIRAQLRLPVKDRVRVMVEAANVLLAVQAHARKARDTGDGSGGGEGLDLVKGVAEPVALDFELVAALQVQPEPFAGAEVPGETQGRVGGDAALAVNDLVDPARGHADRDGDTVLCDPEWFDVVELQDLTGMDRLLGGSGGHRSPCQS